MAVSVVVVAEAAAVMNPLGAALSLNAGGDKQPIPSLG